MSAVKSPALGSVRNMIADAAGLDRATALKTISYLQLRGALPKGGGGRGLGRGHAATVTPEQVALILCALGWAQITKSPMRSAEVAALFNAAPMVGVQDQFSIAMLQKPIEGETPREIVARFAVPRASWKPLADAGGISSFGKTLAGKLRHWSEAKSPDSFDLTAVEFVQQGGALTAALVMGFYEPGEGWKIKKPEPDKRGVAHEGAAFIHRAQEAGAAVQRHVTTVQRIEFTAELIRSLARLYAPEAGAVTVRRGRTVLPGGGPDDPLSAAPPLAAQGLE